MAIKVGQIRHSTSANNYVTALPYTETTFTSITGSTEFQDFTINAAFNAKQIYYVRVDLARININDNMGIISGAGENDPHYQNIEVKLYTTGSSQYQTIGDIIVVEPYDGGDSTSTLVQLENFLLWCKECDEDSNAPNIANYPSNSGRENEFRSLADLYYKTLQAELEARKVNYTAATNNISAPKKTIELIFVPYVNSDRLVFELRRVAYDFNTAHRIVQLATVGNPTDTNIDVGLVNNVLPTGVEKQVEKIGVQTKPGSCVVVNGESMRVGKRGILEVNSGIIIQSVGFVAPGATSDSGNAKINEFILDYIYKEITV